MASLAEKNEYFCSAGPHRDFCSASPHRDKKEFVTVVSVDPIEPLENEQPFVTILAIGDDEAGATAQHCGEAVLVYRLPGERLGFGLKFEGGSNAAECVAKLLIQSCAADSPASRTTVSWGHFAPGDEILEIDGVPVSRMTRMECVRSLKESHVQLKLRVRQGDGLAPRTSPAKSAAPPPVPPRRYPRRKQAAPTAPPLTPPDGFADSPQRLRDKLGVAEAQTYTDLLAQEASGLLESESDDTGSSMSTVVDGKPVSTSTTSNSSFSDVRSVGEETVVDEEALRRTRKFDLDRVLEPFLQLEREFSSCATIEHGDLFQKLVAAAALDDGEAGADCATAPTALEPPDIFQDADGYRLVEEDPSDNTGERLPVICADDVSAPHTSNQNGAPDEVPPKPLPRREIPCRSLTKYGKRRPPPPPPPQVSAKPNRCPTPNDGHVAEPQHESSDSDASVDRLPRLIDFVPKDRVDVVVPSAVHPNPMDMLLERQRIMSMVNAGAAETSAENESDENCASLEPAVELRSCTAVACVDDQEDCSSE